MTNNIFLFYGFGMNIVKTVGVFAGALAGFGVAVGWHPLFWFALIMASVLTSGIYVGVDEQESAIGAEIE